MRLPAHFVATTVLIAALLTPFAPAAAAVAPAAAAVAPSPQTAAPAQAAVTAACATMAVGGTCEIHYDDMGPDGYVDIPVAAFQSGPMSLLVYGGQGGSPGDDPLDGNPGSLVAVGVVVPSNAVSVRLTLGAWGVPLDNGGPSYAAWVYPGGNTAGILTAAGGANPDGGNPHSSVVASGLVHSLVVPGGGIGEGSAMLLLGNGFTQEACSGNFEPRQYYPSAGVEDLVFIAAGGSGTRGHNDVLEGSGAVVSGVADVEGISELNYWVGCSGYESDGAGWGLPGQGGTASYWLATDGGAGGGATVLLNNQNDAGEVLVAAGGGGGTGGESSGATGGRGGSGGAMGDGDNDWNFSGQRGDGQGGVGGCAACNGTAENPDIDGSDGGGGYDSAGGGGGAGFPRGGGGGGTSRAYPGGGGGAGGSYVSYTQASTLNLGPNGDRAAGGVLLLIPVETSTTTLTVQKTVSGADAPGPFTFNASCTVHGQPVFDGSFQVGVGAAHAHTIDAVPVGAECTVTETDSGGATTPAPPQQVTLTSTPVTVTMNNVFTNADVGITVNSALDGDSGQPEPDPLPLGELAVHIACTLDGAPIVLGSPVDANGDVSFTGADTWASGGSTVTVPGVPVNAVCTVAQQHAGPAVVSYTHGGSTSAGPLSFTVAASGNAVMVADAYPLVPLSVHNASSGSDTPPDVAYDITMSCTYAGSPVGLTANQSAFTLGTGETTVVDNLPVGAKCTTAEQNPGDAVAVHYEPSQTVTIAAGVEQTITNVFDSGVVPPSIDPVETAPLEVSVAVVGAGVVRAGSPVVRVDACTLNGQPVDVGPGVDAVDLWFSHTGGTRTVPGVPVGAACDVRLVDAAGGVADGVSMSNAAPFTEDVDDGGGRVTVNVPDAGQATLITIADVFAVAPLTVAVESGGAAAWAANTGYTVEVQCMFDGRPAVWLGPDGITILTYTVTGEVHPSWGATQLAAMPVGSECHASQTSASGATGISYRPVGAGPDGSGDVVLPDGGALITIVNTFDAGSLTIGTEVTGTGVAGYEHSAFLLEQSCTFNGQRLGNPPTDPNRPGQFWLNGTTSRTFTDLPVGAECDVHETHALNASAVLPATSQHGTITAAGLAVTFTNVFDAAPTPPEPTPSGPSGTIATTGIPADGILLTGLALLLTAGALLTLRRRRNTTGSRP